MPAANRIVSEEVSMTDAVATKAVPGAADFVALFEVAKSKNIGMKAIAAGANVSLGALYNALRAAKSGKAIYSEKFFTSVSAVVNA